MSMPHHNRVGRRPGFTLIELLVVIGIIAFLAALLVLIGPAFLKSEKSSRGAQMLQGVLFIAKQQALRDRNPYGIRLLRDPDGQVRSFQYIQQPGDFTGGKVSVTSGSQTVGFTNIDLSGGLGTDQTLWPVQPGDYLQVNTDPYHKIAAVSPNGLTLTNAYSGGTTSTDQYRIARGPRPVAGEDTIFLPDDVIIDLNLSLINPEVVVTDPTTTPPTTIRNYDILFATSGAVMGAAGQSGRIVLWVREADPNNPSATTAPGDQTLITIFTRTGQIGAYPVDTSGPNPYSFTLDPRPGGL